MSSHRLNSDIQELANEVKENFLRRATLLMHSHNPQDAVGGRRSTGHHPAGQVVGHVVKAYSDSDSIVQHTAQVESGKVAEPAKRFVSTLQDRLYATSAQRARREDC